MLFLGVTVFCCVSSCFQATQRVFGTPLVNLDPVQEVCQHDGLGICWSGMSGDGNDNLCEIAISIVTFHTKLALTYIVGVLHT